jgi:hypothetical protein
MAPGTVAAFGSVTTPEMVPVNVCDRRRGTAKREKRIVWRIFMVSDPGLSE